jgi:DNA-binding transcriptional regulator YiaG
MSGLSTRLRGYGIYDAELAADRIEQLERLCKSLENKLIDVQYERDQTHLALRAVYAERDDADARSTAVEAALRTARKNAREQYGMTLRKFAKFCGATASDISKWTADPIEGEPDIVCRG